MGLVEPSREAAGEALELAKGDVSPDLLDSYSFLALGLRLGGETSRAEQHLVAADEIEYALAERHLPQIDGTWWRHLLCDTGRAAVARRLMEAGLETSSDEGWNENVARCERVLARCDLVEGRVGDAEPRLRRAEATFRDGDYVLELAETLVVLAEQRRRAGDLDQASRACGEAIDIASPRELVPTHASALAARARIRADLGTADDLLRARDDADHALRLATKVCQIPWQELDALDSHAHIDGVAGTEGGWAARAARLRARLVPDDLDPDPLATVEAKVAAQREDEDDEPG